MDLLVDLGGGHSLVAKDVGHLVVDVAGEVLGDRGAGNEAREEGGEGSRCVRAAVVQTSLVCESLQGEQRFCCITKDVVAKLQ